MIKEIFKKCGYLIKKKKFVFMTLTFIMICLASVGSTSLGFTKDVNVDLTEPIHEISLLNDNQITLQVQETINNEYDSYLREYASYYSLDSDKVVEFARSVTDNYSISLNDVSGSVKSDTKEGQCMLFVYYLSRDKLSKPLKDYNLSKNSFKVGNKTTTMGKNQMLSSGLTFSQFLGKVCDSLGVDKNYLLAISYLETGKNTSGLALRNNNFGGLRGNGEYFSYPSPEVGIIAFVLNLKGYEKYNFSNIYELSGVYTHGNKSNPSNTWVNSVRKYYNEIINNQAKYFLVEDI